MEESSMTENLYNDSYFLDRSGTNQLRQKSMAQEVNWLKKNVTGKINTVCDIGCAAGEFKKHWPDTQYYGMEINPNAISKAQENGVLFNKDILTCKNFFDLVIYRGTLQHINSPFEYLAATYRALKPDGYVAFLATPNTGSLVYRIAQHLPMLDPSLNLYLPSKKSLIELCQIYGFSTVATETPYFRSPYRNLLVDHLDFIKVVFGGTPKKAFWGNSLNLIAKKCIQ